MKVLSQSTDVVVFRPTGFVRQIEKSDCVRKPFVQKSHPAIRFAPGSGTFVKGFSRSVKGSWDNLVSYLKSGSFIAFCVSEITAIKSTCGSRCRIDVIGVNPLDALAMREAVIFRIQIAALIELRLRTFVIDHRLHAVLIR